MRSTSDDGRRPINVHDCLPAFGLIDQAYPGKLFGNCSSLARIGSSRGFARHGLEPLLSSFAGGVF